METRAVARDDRGDRTAVEWGAAGRPLVVARRERAGQTEALAALAIPIINPSARSSGKGATCACASSSRVSGARRTVRPKAVAGAFTLSFSRRTDANPRLLARALQFAEKSDRFVFFGRAMGLVT